MPPDNLYGNFQYAHGYDNACISWQAGRKASLDLDPNKGVRLARIASLRRNSNLYLGAIHVFTSKIISPDWDPKYPKKRNNRSNTDWDDLR